MELFTKMKSKFISIYSSRKRMHSIEILSQFMYDTEFT